MEPRICKNCGVLPLERFLVRKSGYVANACHECEKVAARDRRKSSYADPSKRVEIQNQNSDWRSRNAGVLSERFRSRYAGDSGFRDAVLQRNRASKDPLRSIVKKAGSSESSKGVREFFSQFDSFESFASSFRENGYLPSPDDVASVHRRLAASRVSSPLPQSYAGLGYLDNVFSHRFKAKTSGSLSLEEAFLSDAALRDAVEYIVQDGRVPTKELILRNMKFNVLMPSHFLPDSAAALVACYARGGDVLDPFLGWGGRTLGAVCAGARSMSGTDLQPESVSGCRRVVSDFGALSGTVGDFHHCDFSKFMQETDRRFDLVLTSPPFVDTEDYGSGHHGSTAAWIGSVVLPLVRGSGRVLREGGRAAVHVQERPKMPVMSSVLSCFTGAGWSLEAEHRYGRKGGQSVLVFRAPS